MINNILHEKIITIWVDYMHVTLGQQWWCRRSISEVMRNWSTLAIWWARRRKKWSKCDRNTEKCIKKTDNGIAWSENTKKPSLWLLFNSVLVIEQHFITLFYLTYWHTWPQSFVYHLNHCCVLLHKLLFCFSLLLVQFLSVLWVFSFSSFFFSVLPLRVLIHT